MKGLKHWFEKAVPRGADFRVRGIGVQERMRPKMVNRPRGTGDYLFMFFYDPVRIQVQGEVRDFPARSLIAWTPDAGHHYGRTTASWLHSWIHCEGPFVERQVKAAGLRMNQPLVLEDPLILERPLLAIHEELITQAEPDSVILENLFANFLRGVRRATAPGRAPSLIPERFLRVKAFLEAHYAEKVTLAALARMAGLSVPHFCSQFRRYFDVPALDFAIRLRMQAAAYHLRNCNHSIQDVARLVGYEDIFYFSKLFKKRFGASPRAMRTRLLAGGTCRPAKS